LAAAIHDAHPNWRPRLSELASLIQNTDKKQQLKLLRAGHAYGVAKHLRSLSLPGIALLLFGAAVDAVGEMPQVELDESISRAETEIRKAGLHQNPDVKKLIEAAKDRARLDKVSQKIRIGLKNGLMRTGKFTELKADELAKKIVDVTHNVRHDALLDKFGWTTEVVPKFRTDS
jgi:hypothetical protein